MYPDTEARLYKEIEAVIDRIQGIQARIAGTGEPTSALELHALQRLGSRYSQLLERLDKLRNAAQDTKDGPS